MIYDLGYMESAKTWVFWSEGWRTLRINSRIDMYIPLTNRFASTLEEARNKFNSKCEGEDFVVYLGYQR